MAATIARLHRVGSHQAGAAPGSWPAEAVSSGADTEDGLLDRIAAAGAVALLIGLLLGLMVGEYLLLWHLLFAPWADSVPLLMP
jgi:hypothetical protein